MHADHLACDARAHHGVQLQPRKLKNCCIKKVLNAGAFGSDESNEAISKMVVLHRSDRKLIESAPNLTQARA